MSRSSTASEINRNILSRSRRRFVGGSDARIIMGQDEAALIRLWREKRGEVEPEDLSGNLLVQLGVVTEHLNRQWFERNTGRAVKDMQKRVRHPVLRWMGGHPRRDGRSDRRGVRVEIHAPMVLLRRSGRAKVSAAASAQHVGDELNYLSALHHHRWRQMGRNRGPGGFALPAPAVHTAEKKFWRCVESGEPPRLFGIETPPPRLEAVRIFDMSSANSWAEFAVQFRETQDAFLKHEHAKAELKALMPQDAKEAVGHGIRARRSKAGAVSFEVIEQERSHAALQ